MSSPGTSASGGVGGFSDAGGFVTGCSRFPSTWTRRATVSRVCSDPSTWIKAPFTARSPKISACCPKRTMRGHSVASRRQAEPIEVTVVNVIAVSNMSPRLGGTPGDSRGLEGSTDSAENRALATEVACRRSFLKSLDAGSIPAAFTNALWRRFMPPYNR